MRLHLIRHADTGIVERAQKPQDDLDATGFKQAEVLAERLASAEISAIYASPYQRALTTAKVVVEQFPSLDVQIDERLKETPLWISPADLRDDSKREYSEAKALLNTTQSEMLKFLDELCARYTGESILVVAHGNLIRATVGVLLKMPLDSIVRLTVTHTSITTFEWINDSQLPFFLLERFNDVGHLEGLSF